MAASQQFGALLETHVLQNLMAFAHLLPSSPKVLYWRTARGEEVDLVLETADRVLPLEIKATRRLGHDDLKGMSAFLQEYPDLAPFGVVLYAGTEWQRPARNVVALPWTTFAAN